MDYGHDRDAIQIATTYGFIDASCTMARSAVSDEVYGTGVRPSEDVVSADRALLDALLHVLADEPGPAAATLRGAVEHQRGLVG